MKIQSHPSTHAPAHAPAHSLARLLTSNRLPGRKGRSNTANTGIDVPADVAELPPLDDLPPMPAVGTNNTNNMQALAAELQQAAAQSVFSYNKNVVLVAKTLAALVIMLSLAHVGLVLIPLMTVDNHLSLGALASWTTLGLALGVVAAAFAAALLVNLFPSIQVSAQGLGVLELTGWRVVPWSQIGVLRVMELRSRSRYVVFVPFRGAGAAKVRPATPAPMLRFIPALAGTSQQGERGVLFTSDIKNFERLLQLIVSYMAQTSGQNPNAVAVEAFVDEDATMPIAQLLLAPTSAIARVASSRSGQDDPYSLTQADSDPQIVWSKVLVRQLPIALVPALLLLSDVLVRNYDRPVVWGHIVGAVALVALGIAELPFAGWLVQAVGELMVGSGQFRRTIWAYLELQAPRTLLIALGAAMLGFGAPAFFAEALWLAGIVLTTLFTVRFVQRLYYMPLSHTLLAALGVFIYQFSLLALYFGVR